MFSLIQDRRGRFCPHRAITLAVLCAPMLHLLFRAATGDLGGRPVMEATHKTGDFAVYFLLASLAITPLRAILDWPRLIPLRRMIGVASACYAGAHLLIYCLDQKFHMLTVASEIALRFYLTIGFVAVLGLLVLAVTSTDRMIARLGRRWKPIHKLAYPIAVIALLHYFLQSKADVSSAVFVTGLFVWEMLWRATPRAARMNWWPLPVLAVVAAFATAALEFAWYGAATRIDPLRVLGANLDLSYGPRPAVAILLAGLALAAVAGIRRWRQSGGVAVA
jgi:sulfoxide reductase heme-binding subunit YedZ